MQRQHPKQEADKVAGSSPLWLAAPVPNGVDDPAHQPNGAKDGGKDGEPEAGQENVHEEEGELLQGAVVSALGAVEVGVLLRAHRWVVDGVASAELADAERQDEVEHEGVDGNHHDVAVLAVYLDGGHGFF